MRKERGDGSWVGVIELYESAGVGKKGTKWRLCKETRACKERGCRRPSISRSISRSISVAAEQGISLPTATAAAAA
ncbi:MAG: hypothetical protein ACK55Z_07765, partial [bacterium]